MTKPSSSNSKPRKKTQKKSGASSAAPVRRKKTQKPNTQAQEIGGRGGLDPTRYGDWEIGGKCVDF